MQKTTYLINDLINLLNLMATYFKLVRIGVIKDLVYCEMLKDTEETSI